MESYKIVLTGGPCGGKSTSIDFIGNKLKKLGYSVDVIDETARTLLKLGYIPNNNISTFDFQNLLFKVQFLKEYRSEKKSSFMLCDRGLLDGKAYMSDEEFKKILTLNDILEETILSTYDLALYFRSIAHEYPEEFKKQRIFETPEISRIRDERCRDIWREKIKFDNCDNLYGFDKKQKLICDFLINYLDDLKKIKSNKLSDYYGLDYINFLFEGIEDIMKSTNVSEDVKVKTRGVIK